VAVNREGPVRGLVWLGRRLRFVGSFLALGVVAAACTWLALVTLSGLSALVAAVAGLGETGAAISHGVVLLVAVAGLAVGGLLADRALGESAVGVVGVPPRVLVYEMFGSWRRALAAIGGSLVVVATLWSAVVGRPSSERRQSSLASAGPREWTRQVEVYNKEYK
jgi:hypothetical protein